MPKTLQCYGLSPKQQSSTDPKTLMPFWTPTMCSPPNNYFSLVSNNLVLPLPWLAWQLRLPLPSWQLPETSPAGWGVAFLCRDQRRVKMAKTCLTPWRRIRTQSEPRHLRNCCWCCPHSRCSRRFLTKLSHFCALIKRLEMRHLEKNTVKTQELRFVRQCIKIHIVINHVWLFLLQGSTFK